MTIDVWSDVACPWCWLGHAHLRRAGEQAGIALEVTFHSFQLSPQQAVVEPVRTYLARKYGDMARIDAAQERLQEMGSRVGIDYDFEPALAANTFDAHRLHHFAASQGRGDEVMEALFRAQHAEGADVSDHAVLQRIAQAAGLDTSQVAEVLSSDAYAYAVRQDLEDARRNGIHGVPFFVLGGRFAVSGAQPINVFVRALQKALAANGPGQTKT